MPVHTLLDLITSVTAHPGFLNPNLLPDLTTALLGSTAASSPDIDGGELNLDT